MPSEADWHASIKPIPHRVQASYGHTEGTAGITGALLAVSALQTAMAPGIVNLISMNPYVAVAIEDWGARQGMAALLPRQTGPAIYHVKVILTAKVVIIYTICKSVEGIDTAGEIQE